MYLAEILNYYYFVEYKQLEGLFNMYKNNIASKPWGE